MVLKRCFDGFADEDGSIPADNVGGILTMMGMKVKPSALREIIDEIDEDGELKKILGIYFYCNIQVLDCLSLWSSVNLLPSSWLRKMRKP